MRITKCRTYETTSIYRIELTEEKLKSLFDKTIEELQKDGFEQFKKKYFSDEKSIKKFLSNDVYPMGMLENSMADRLDYMLLDGWWDDHFGEETATIIEIDDDL